MKVIATEQIPIKMWLDDIEEGALKQAINLANLPFAFKHIAIMPDCHQGYGMPIGGVLATQNVVIPNAVGVDIGCGMCAVKTQLRKISRDVLQTILEQIRRAIPVGHNHHKNPQDSALMPRNVPFSSSSIVSQEYESALKQLGTLGGGNHFIEIQKDEEGYIWIMIHSGSRNIGYKVANYYNKKAVEINEFWFSMVPKKWELAFFPWDSVEGIEYLAEMDYCVEFALANRRLMMNRVVEIFHNNFPNQEMSNMINIAHNYAAMENHFNTNVMVHRKGATRARRDEIGIIPGSQGTPSYIVRGLGNAQSFQSCSHGAGRVMGRKQAQRELNLADEQKKLDDQGILHSVRGIKNLDEASGAYKDIDKVMENQSDLVEIVTKLTPLAVVKG